MGSNPSFKLHVEPEALTWDESLRQRLVSFQKRFNWSFPQLSRDIQRFFGRGKDKDNRSRNTGLSQTAIHNYVATNWPSSQDALEKFEQRLREWLDNREGGGSEPQIDEDVAAAKLIRHGLLEAQSSGKFVIIVGPSGMGKSLLAHHYANRKTRGAMVIVEAYDSMTPRAFLSAICRALGDLDTGSVDHLINRVVASLVEQPRLLAIDEANFLTYHSVNHLIFIYNKAKVGIVLLGTSELEQIMRHPKLERVRSRLKVAITLESLTDEDIRHRLEESFEAKEVTARVVEMAKIGSYGSYRDLDTLIESAADFLEEHIGKSLESAFESVASRTLGRRSDKRR